MRSTSCIDPRLRVRDKAAGIDQPGIEERLEERVVLFVVVRGNVAPTPSKAVCETDPQQAPGQGKVQRFGHATVEAVADQDREEFGEAPLLHLEVSAHKGLPHAKVSVGEDSLKESGIMDADNRRRGRVLVSTHSHPALAQQELQAGVDDETVEQ